MKLVSNVKNRVSNVKNHVKTNVHALAKTIKYYFYYAPKRFVMLKYYKLYELVAYRLLATTTVMVRNLIIRQGKNPDYVAPPVVAQAEPTVDDVFSKPKRKQLNVPYVPSWVRASFRTISEHPTYKSRVNLNLQPNRTPVLSVPVQESLQVALAPEVVPVPEVTACDQCLHSDHDGLHTCEEFKPRLPEIELVVPEGSIDGGVTVDETGNVVFGFIKYGDKE